MLYKSAIDTVVVAWLCGNALVLINEVTLRLSRLVLGWMTVFGGHTTLVSLPSHLGQLSLLHSVGPEMSTSQRAAMLCG